ncbi:MAG: 30S ribosome-binding factor RbfA [Gammaproteobacteria bacterium]|nr:30S ribosome-binding factor RbfA [Gammaproteobacteria bacterium]
MHTESQRSKKVGEQIQRELALIINQEIKDPRVSWVTVAAVHVSRDFAHAKVYVTSLVENKNREQLVQILNNASGFMRRQLGKILKIRTVPELHFVYDESVEYGNRLSKLIDDAVAHDKISKQD